MAVSSLLHICSVLAVCLSLGPGSVQHTSWIRGISAFKRDLVCVAWNSRSLEGKMGQICCPGSTREYLICGTLTNLLSIWIVFAEGSNHTHFSFVCIWPMLSNIIFTVFLNTKHFLSDLSLLTASTRTLVLKQREAFSASVCRNLSQVGSQNPTWLLTWAERSRWRWMMGNAKWASRTCSTISRLHQEPLNVEFRGGWVTPNLLRKVFISSQPLRLDASLWPSCSLKYIYLFIK